jgi:hypothetical protein
VEEARVKVDHLRIITYIYLYESCDGNWKMKLSWQLGKKVVMGNLYLNIRSLVEYTGLVELFPEVSGDFIWQG